MLRDIYLQHCMADRPFLINMKKIRKHWLFQSPAPLITPMLSFDNGHPINIEKEESAKGTSLENPGIPPPKGKKSSQGRGLSLMAKPVTHIPRENSNTRPELSLRTYLGTKNRPYTCTTRRHI